MVDQHNGTGAVCRRTTECVKTTLEKRSRKAIADGKITGIIPFLGYHHVLMILIAIAIILLCKVICFLHPQTFDRHTG